MSRPAKKIFLIFFYCCFNLCANAQSNEGTEFWFGFMEQVDFDTNTKVVMVTSKQGTTGEISIPGQGWSQSFTVAPNDVSLIIVPEFAESKGSEVITPNAINVRTQNLSSVYIHQYQNNRSEATIVLPVSALGDTYYAMTYTGIFEIGNHYPAEFLAIAYEDDTELTIQLADESRMGRPAGSVFTVTLDKGETYQLQAALNTSDLTGSLITGNKNFNLLAGNTWSRIPMECGFRDNLIEQMTPLSTWGRQFVAVPLVEMDFTILKILASKDNTEVTITESQNTISFQLNTGEFVAHRVFNEAAFINSNEPILVGQFIPGQMCSGHSLGDPAMLVLNAVEQNRDTVTLYNSSFQNIKENYINIIVLTADIDNVYIDGERAIDRFINFVTLGPNDEYAYAHVRVAPGPHTLISQGCGLIATAYGYGEYESYAYSGGASFRALNEAPIPEGGCLNDTLLFDAGLFPFRFSLNWDFGDGTISDQNVVKHVYSSLGTYPVELIVHDECLDTRDTFNQDVIISLRQPVAVDPDVEVCLGEDVALGATDVGGALYEWTGPRLFTSTLQFPFIPNTSFADSGLYTVIGNVSGCKTFPAQQMVDVRPIPNPDLGPDTIICSLQNQSVVLSADGFDSYRWQDLSTLPTFEATEDGSYWVNVGNEFNCFASDTIQLRKQCPTRIFVPNIFTPNDDGINDEFRVFAEDVISFKLQVFNRWGGILFETEDINEVWDPWENGRVLNNGVYTWMILLEGYQEDGSVFNEVMSGTVTVIK